MAEFKSPRGSEDSVASSTPGASGVRSSRLSVISTPASSVCSSTSIARRSSGCDLSPVGWYDGRTPVLGIVGVAGAIGALLMVITFARDTNSGRAWRRRQ